MNDALDPKLARSSLIEAMEAAFSDMAFIDVAPVPEMPPLARQVPVGSGAPANVRVVQPGAVPDANVVEFSLACQDGAGQPAEFWSDLPSVVSCRREAAAFHLSVTEPHRVLPALVERLEQRRWQLSSLLTRHASLDDVFVVLTGRQLEQAEEANS